MTVLDDSGGRLLEHLNIEIRPTETVAVIGPAGSGSEVFAELLARFVWPDSGRLTIDGQDILSLPESITGRRIAYASSDAYFFSGSLRDNLLYGLKHAPLTEVRYEGAAATQRRWQVQEAMRAKNPDLDLNSDWVDYASMGISDATELYKVVRPVLEAVLIKQDIIDLALRSQVDTIAHPELVEHIVELRQALRDRLGKEDWMTSWFPLSRTSTTLRQPLAKTCFWVCSTVRQCQSGNWLRTPSFKKIMIENDLYGDLYHMGLEIAENAIELFRICRQTTPSSSSLLSCIRRISRRISCFCRN